MRVAVSALRNSQGAATHGIQSDAQVHCCQQEVPQLLRHKLLNSSRQHHTCQRPWARSKVRLQELRKKNRRAGSMQSHLNLFSSDKAAGAAGLAGYSGSSDD